MLIGIRNILFVLLVLSIFGYIFVVVRQKILLKNNIVFINKKSITKELLEKADLKQFTLEGSKVKSGDEIRVITTEKEKIEGILIGISQKEKIILVVTYQDTVAKCKLEEIFEIQIISKYGYFF